MTLASSAVKVQYNGDGSTVAFAITFVFWDNTDIRAVLRDTDDGTETVWVLGTDFTLSGGSGATGTLTATTAPASDETLTIKSNRSITQETDLALGGPLPSPDIELALDQNTRLVQQLDESLERAILLPESTAVTDVTFPDLAANAEELLRINAAGTGLEGVGLADLSGSSLTTPVSLTLGGTAANLSNTNGLRLIRMNSGATALEGIAVSAAIRQLFAQDSDIASADPLIVSGADGSYYDVTGTTDFSAMTIAANRLVILQFDGALAMTNGASLDLGGADITTTAGDIGIFYSTAANTVQLIAWFGTTKRTKWIPATQMTPTVSNGCAALASVETTAGRPDMNVLDFDASSDEHAQFSVAFPKGWNLGTITFKVYWTSTAADTDGVAWGLQGVACDDGDTIDVAYGTAVVVTQDAQGTAEDQYITGESDPVTIAGSPAADEVCYFRIFRDVSDANDDMTEDARLIGVKLLYTHSPTPTDE